MILTNDIKLFTLNEELYSNLLNQNSNVKCILLNEEKKITLIKASN